MTSQNLERARHDLGPVLARLKAIRTLSRAEIALIESLGSRSRVISAGALLLEEGKTVARAAYVLSGWACRQSTLPDGRRQVVSFILPGEGVGLCRRPRPLAFTTTLALTNLTIVDAGPLLSDESDVAAGLNDVLELSAAADEQRLIHHVVRLGRQTAYERFCSLFLELADRFELINPGECDRFALPVTQEVLSDALGLSIVHVNRTLQQMKRNELIDLRSGTLRILNRPVMERLATGA